MDPWPHQIYATDEVRAALQKGEKRILVTTPTGGGKTWTMLNVGQESLDGWGKVVLYTNRRPLIEQTSRVMAKAGMKFGVRAAGHEDRRSLDLQLSSIQTEDTRWRRQKKWQLHDADLVVVDEAHSQRENMAGRILKAHHDAGAAYVGFTATPLDLSHLYDYLIVAGTNSSLRECGATVWCDHYAPDEPDLLAWKRELGTKAIVGYGQDLSEKQIRSVMGSVDEDGRPNQRLTCLFGRVLEWFTKLNPKALPTVLFAPGVKESLWFAAVFSQAGIRAAHVDGNNVWLDGEFHDSDPEIRQHVYEESANGRLPLISNRFVFREGWNAPWIRHGIFCTIFGSLQSYLQSGGRLLRNAGDGLPKTLQDHGGNYWRHGSLNSDQVWTLDMTSESIAYLRDQQLRSKKCGRCAHPLRPLNPVCEACSYINMSEGTRCPECGLVLAFGKCKCGFRVTTRARAVLQSDGSLKMMQGDVYKPRREYRAADAAKKWKSYYYRAASAKWNATFEQAIALFAFENYGRWPPRDLPLMPIERIDWLRKVRDFPREKLR